MLVDCCPKIWPDVVIVIFVAVFVHILVSIMLGCGEDVSG